MSVRNAEAVWEGGLRDGRGKLKLGSGAFEGPYTYQSRFEEEAGTNPEELIGAALAGCFSMFLSAVLGKAGFAPRTIRTSAKVHLETVGGGPAVTKIELDTRADIPGIDETTFLEKAQAAKAGCPVSRSLTGTEIVLTARLES
ncbi:MAG: OsmC family protein [Acidobacteriota bacterium]|nr:OsmC family protein [Acidobacteriota bacterium]